MCNYILLCICSFKACHYRVDCYNLAWPEFCSVDAIKMFIKDMLCLHHWTWTLYCTEHN